MHQRDPNAKNEGFGSFINLVFFVHNCFPPKLQLRIPLTSAVNRAGGEGVDSTPPTSSPPQRGRGELPLIRSERCQNSLKANATNKGGNRHEM